ncbi:MAG: DUF177 domain-containing protein [Chloroflexi bacterium]|nr:DUF177 domain-containing protein [Chloroflexota bacterium]
MNYNVSQLLKEPIGSERDFTITKGETADHSFPIDYAAGYAKLIRTHQGIWVQASVTAQVSQDCSRCLAEASHALDLEIDEEYFPEIDVRTGHQISPPTDWEGLYIGADNLLDLAEAIRQSALAILPLKPLCTPDCPGICDICGVNRNHHQCGCYSEQIDPRWEALRSLMADTKI